MKYAPHIAVAVVILIAGVLLWQHYGPKPDDTPKPPPTAGTVPVHVADNVTHGDPALPKPDSHTTGILHIAIPDTAHPGVPREIFIYLDRDPSVPPLIKSDSPIQAEFSPVVDPWIMLQAHVLIGGSLSNAGDVSPWGGVAAVRLFRNFDIGGGIDEDGIGVFISYQAWREFDVGAMWYVLPILQSDARVCVFLAYRF